MKKKEEEAEKKKAKQNDINMLFDEENEKDGEKSQPVSESEEVKIKSSK